MKYLKTSFKKFINESTTDKILYHGSPYRFESFRPTTTFFTDDRSFAEDYSDQKSFDAEMDSETNIYTVKLLGNIFDASDEKELKELSMTLPESIKFSYNNFGFIAELPREEFLLNMRGYDVIEPLEGINNMEIGDTFPDPMYDREDFMIVKKDNKHAFVINKQRFDRDLESSIGKNKEIRDLILEFAKKQENRDYIPEHLYKAYVETFRSNGDWLGKPSSEEIDKFIILEEQVRREAIESDLKKGYTKKFVLEPTEIELDNTWRYYENQTIKEAIIKLGYDGYVAKESKKNTYCIFRPDKAIEIVKYEFPIGHEFDNYDDIRNMHKFDKEIYEKIKVMKNYNKVSLFINKYDIYRAFKKGLTPDEFLDSFFKKYKDEL